MKPIVMLASGTRGDVQPAIALALGISRSGLPVRLAAPPAYQVWIEGYGLPFAPIESNPSDLLTRPGAQSTLTYDGRPLHNLRASLSYIKEARPLYASMLESAWQASRDACALLISLPTIWGVHFAEALNIPCLGAFLQPVTPTRDFPAPVFPFPSNLGGMFNCWTYSAAGLATWLPWNKIYNRFRSDTLGLQPLHWSGPRPLPFGVLNAMLYGFSPLLVPPRGDWTGPVHVTGFWNLPSQSFTPSPALHNFLLSGAPPVYIGFGSPGVLSPNDILDTLLDAIETARVRALIALAGVTPKNLPGNVHLLQESVPHEWLFPRMAGLIHHGGAGTTAAGLLAGKPSLILPLATDQFFWGQRIWEQGLGPAPITRSQLTAQRLGKAIQDLVYNQEMQMNARACGQALRVEDGVGQAVHILRQYIQAGS